MCEDTWLLIASMSLQQRWSRVIKGGWCTCMCIASGSIRPLHRPSTTGMCTYPLTSLPSACLVNSWFGGYTSGSSRLQCHLLVRGPLAFP